MAMVVLVGIDVHKHTHCAVAVDEVGRQLQVPLTVRTTDAGNRQLLRWAAREFAGQQVQFAVEDCRQLTNRLERALLTAGATVFRVPPSLMAGARQSARTRGKSDPIDALAIARAALREPDLPRAEHTHQSREMKLLSDHRNNLLRARIALQNRLRWQLHELDPELDPPGRSLDRTCQLDRVEQALDAMSASTVRRLALENLADIRALTSRINGLEKELQALVKAHAPQLLGVVGCAALTAATLVGETANPDRFPNEARFAMYAGVAPIPASSGKTNRHRLARGGNRDINAALYRIVITQIRLPGPGQEFYQRRRSQGDTSAEAIRALKRRLARVIYNLLRNPTGTGEAALAEAA
jgi:transposase